MVNCKRREFIKTAGIVAAGAGLAGSLPFCSKDGGVKPNAIPRWKGFNLLDYFLRTI